MTGPCWLSVAECATFCATILQKNGQAANRCKKGATRFDKLAVHYEATVHVASITIWLRCLKRRR